MGVCTYLHLWIGFGMHFFLKLGHVHLSMSAYAALTKSHTWHEKEKGKKSSRNRKRFEGKT